MGIYETGLGAGPGEFGEFGEGELGELGEFGEGQFGEGEFGEGETLETQDLGRESGSPLSEGEQSQLASELLEISSEGELEAFLGGLMKKVARGVGGFIKSPIGQALGGVLKSVAKKALPVVGGALGSLVAPGVGTALGSKLGSLASGLFEVQMEGVPLEQAEYEVARKFVNLAAASARNAALAPPRASGHPASIARAAVAQAARVHAPGLYRSMVPYLRTPRGRAPGIPHRPPVVPPRPPRLAPRPTVYEPVPFPDLGDLGAPEDVLRSDGDGSAGATLSGRWVRRGRKIVVLGV